MLNHELNCILLFNYKLSLPKYNINDVIYVGLKSMQYKSRFYESCLELLVNLLCEIFHD